MGINMKYYTKDSYMSKNMDFNIWEYTTCKNVETHMHEFIELVYIKGGSGIHVVNGMSFNVQRGSLVCIDKGQTHAFTVEGHLIYVNITLMPSFMSRTLNNSATLLDILSIIMYEDAKKSFETATPLTQFSGREMLNVEYLIDSMCDEIINKHDEYKNVICSYMQVLFTYIIRNIHQCQSEYLFHDIRESLPKVLEYLNQNYNKKITIEDVANENYYNAAYLGRMFKQYYGINFTSYLHQKRIDRSLQMLRDTDLPIDQISRHVGYNDKKNFYYIFKKSIGVTPNVYRKQHKYPTEQ